MPDQTTVTTSGNGDGPIVLTSRKASEEKPFRTGEMEVVDLVENLYTDAELAKQDQCEPDTWAENLETYWGEQWEGAIPSYKPRIVVNEIKSLFLQELSDLTDSRLDVYVEKSTGKSDERDKMVETSIHSFRTRRSCDIAELHAALDAMIHPLGFLQSGWDPRAQQGQGEVTYRHRDPTTVFPDGDAEDDESVRFFVLHDVEDLVQIRRDFPETGWLVKPDADYSVKLSEDKNRPAPKAGSGYTGPLYSQTYGGGGVPGYRKARARMLTCVVDDDAIKEEIRSIRGELRQVDVPAYPNKRLIIVANRRVLYDEDCPYHYAPILTRVQLQPATHAYWPARSMLSEFAEIQKTANKSDSAAVENMLRINVGEIFADADSGLTPKTYGGIPGMVYLIKPGSKVVKQAGTPMPPEFVNNGERLRGNIRSTMGFPMSRTGAGTHGNVAAELAETEISQSMGLTRLRGRLLHHSIQQATRMIFARMAQFYTTPRHMPFIDGGEWRSVKWEPIADASGYVVHVDPSSFTVRSKTMMSRLYLALAQMQKMPTGRLLKALQIPDAEAITAELSQELQLKALAHVKAPKARKAK